MKNPEIHALSMGRMMCVSALVESGWPSTMNPKQLTNIVDMLYEMYKDQQFLRESIQLILVKIMKSPSKTTKLFDHIVDKFLLDLGKDESATDRILSSHSTLAMFLELRAMYLETETSSAHGEVLSL